MNVKELMVWLAQCDPESEVILQKDGEGNGYSPIAGADSMAVYVPDTTWSGTVYSRSWSAEDAGMNSEEWDRLMREPSCVVLYPIN